MGRVRPLATLRQLAGLGALRSLTLEPAREFPIQSAETVIDMHLARGAGEPGQKRSQRFAHGERLLNRAIDAVLHMQPGGIVRLLIGRDQLGVEIL